MPSQRTVTHLYAVIRLDSRTIDWEEPESAVTVKEIHPTMEAAQEEAERLNELAKTRGIDCLYFWQLTRWRQSELPGESP